MLLTWASNALPRVLLAAVLWPPTPPASRPWWMAACIAYEATRLALVPATATAAAGPGTNTTLSGAAALLDMVLVGCVYGTWAITVTVLARSGTVRVHQCPVDNGDVATDSSVQQQAMMTKVQQLERVVHAKNLAEPEDPERSLSASSSISTNLSSTAASMVGEQGTLKDDAAHKDLARLHTQISTDLLTLGLTCPPATDPPSSSAHPSSSPPSHTSHDTMVSVPLSPGGWIASSHLLAAVETQAADASSNTTCLHATDPSPPLALPAAPLARSTASSSVASLASFASATNLLLSGNSKDAPSEDASQPPAATPCVHVPTEAGDVVVDPCVLPLPPSRSRLLLDDDHDDGGALRVKSLALQPLATLASVGELQGSQAALEDEPNVGGRRVAESECQGFQL